MIYYCKCGCGEKLRKDNKTGYQKCHKPCAICSKHVKRSDTECCSKSCSAKLHWIQHPELKENRKWNKARNDVRSKNKQWRKSCSISAKETYKNGRIVWNRGKIFNTLLTPEERFDKRLITEYHDWIKSVFERDKYTCQLTGIKGKKISGHHLYSWDKNKEKRLDINNGITILKELHDEFHNMYGIGNNTPEQFEDYKKKKKINKINYV